MKILDVPRSGSYQGITSSRNRYGQYVRTRATPVNPASSYQMSVRSRLATNAADWRALDATQRAGWGALGDQILRADSLGSYYTLTGFQAYVLVNNNNLAAGNAIVSDAPALDTPEGLDSITLTATTASLSVAYTATPLAAGERAFISLGPIRSAGVGFEGDYRLIAVTAAAAASPANVLSAYQARFGTPTLGSKIFAVIQRYRGGFLSSAISTSAIVA